MPKTKQELAKHKSDYYFKNKEKIMQNKAKNKEHLKEYSWKRQGIDLTHQEYICMFTKQDGRCLICEVPQEECKKSLCVDHDHVTGKIRGLLCDICNKSLGGFKDNIELLEKAIAYLKKER